MYYFSIMDSLPKVETKSMDSLISGCTHEMAYNVGLAIPPLLPRQVILYFTVFNFYTGNRN